MLIRLPWILSRKRFVIAVVADWLLFAFSYYLLYEWSFNSLPAFSPSMVVLLATWSLSSYVAGRYVSGSNLNDENHAWNVVGKQLTATSFVLLLTLCVATAHVWLVNHHLTQGPYSILLISFLGLLAILSFLVQLLIGYLFALQESNKNSVWCYVGTESDFIQLQKMLKWSRIQVSIKHVLPQDLMHPCPQFFVNNFHDHSVDLLEKLYSFHKKGSIVLSRLSWCELILQRFPAEFISDGDLLDGRFSMPYGTLQSRLKRVGDFAVALLLIIFTSPLIGVAALLIKVEDGGPVFYSQVRTGKRGNPFKIWKLRSMRIDAENQGAQWSSRSDPRITKVGAMLRRTRLDELPQLWCVLTGSMSLIGPRPERPEFDKQLSLHIPYYNLRHLMRPGLSGWAQVNYHYGASITDSANKLSYDLFYLKNFSFLLDLLILFKTIRLVFNAQGALPDSSSHSEPLHLNDT